MGEPSSEAAVWARPASSAIRARWAEVFDDPLLSPAALRAAATSKAGLGEAAEDGGVVLRSVYWRAYHALLPDPTAPHLFGPALDSARRGYDELRARYCVAPDGRWAADCTGAESWAGGAASGTGGTGSAARSSLDGRGAEWDPLSLDGESPWKTWFAHVELRALIRQDVERTFPDIAYFTLERVRRALTTALFLFAVINPDVGYRQGMHELLAVCYLAVDRDSLVPPPPEAAGAAPPTSPTPGQERERAMWRTLDRRFVEHDAAALFAAVMKGAKPLYEWRAEEGPAPVIVRCGHIHHTLLRRIDPQLWERLETEGVEAQIWAIRWLRLIFTRELPFTLAMRLWDGVFAEDPGLGILDFIIVAMLLLIRNDLIDAEYPALLTHLLHYPAPSPAYPFSPPLVVAQALFLRDNVSPAAGVQVVVQNQDLLGVKVARDDGDELQPPGTPGSARRHAQGAHARSDSRFAAGAAGRRGQVQSLAQGWLERAQAAGIDRAIMSTVADLRKNLPDTATAYSYLPNLPFSPISPPPGDRPALSAFPSPSALSPRARGAQPAAGPSVHAPAPRGFHGSAAPAAPVPEGRPRMPSVLSVDSVGERSVLDAERQVAELRLAMMGMGKAMGEWLDVLRAAEPGSASETGQAGQAGESAAAGLGEGSDGIGLGDRHADAGAGEAARAWAGLERVRDSLLDAAGSDVDDIVKQWGWHDGLEAPRSRATTPTPAAGQRAGRAGRAGRVDDAGPSASGATVPAEPEQESAAPSASASPAPPAPPVAVIPASPDPSEPSASMSTARPPLYLSTRHDRPAAGLSRVPAAAPVATPLPASQVPAPAVRSEPLTPRADNRASPPRAATAVPSRTGSASGSVSTGGHRLAGPPVRKGERAGREGVDGAQGDPLAGLGVSVRPAPGLGSTGSGAGRPQASAPVGDPLGVGR